MFPQDPLVQDPFVQDLPDVTDLALIIQDPKQPRERAECALTALDPCIREIARRIRARYGDTRRDEFCDDAVSWIWERLKDRKFDPQRGRFPTWCSKVLENRFKDLCRQGKCRLHHESIKYAETPRVIIAGVDQELDLKAPFSPPDLAKIRGWKTLRAGLIVLCDSRLWVKVPGPTWKELCAEAGLPDDFPPIDFKTANDGEGRGYLAAAAGVHSATINQYWCRMRHLIGSLDFIRNLEP